MLILVTFSALDRTHKRKMTKCLVLLVLLCVTAQLMMSEGIPVDIEEDEWQDNLEDLALENEGSKKQIKYIHIVVVGFSQVPLQIQYHKYCVAKRYTNLLKSSCALHAS